MSCAKTIGVGVWLAGLLLAGVAEACQPYHAIQDGEGGVMAGNAVLTVTLAGTQTKATVYSDPSCTTAKANPVLKSGMDWSFYAADGIYDLAFSLNTFKYPPLYGVALFGSGNGTFTVNCPTNGTDAAACIQATITAASDGDTIHFLRGIYTVLSTIVVDKKVRLLGPFAYGDLNPLVTGAVLAGTGITILRLDDAAIVDGLTIYDATGHASTVGIEINQQWKWKLMNCAVMGPSGAFGTLGTGIRFKAALTGAVDNCTVEGWLNGMEFVNVGGNQPNMNYVTASKMRQNTIGVLVTSIDDGIFSGNVIEGNSTGLKLVSGKITLLQNHFENNLGDQRQVHVTGGNLVSIGNGYFFVGADKDIYIESGAGVHSSTGDTLNGGIKHNGSGLVSLQMPILAPIVSGTGMIVRVDGFGIIGLQGSSDIVLTPTGDIKWGKPLVALGGGAAPTLGTIGGSGPATAAQNSWLRMLDSTGASVWVPVWK